MGQLQRRSLLSVNHARIAQQALHYRNAMVVDSYTAGRFDPAAVANIAVECGDPIIDSAIRRIGTAWVRGGLAAEALTETWSGPSVDRIFSEDPTLLDAIDDIIRTVHRVQFSRPRPLSRPRRFAPSRPMHHRSL